MRIYIPEDTDFATKKNNTENAAWLWQEGKESGSSAAGPTTLRQSD